MVRISIVRFNQIGILKHCEPIDENLSVNTEYLTDTIVLLAAAVIAVPLFQSLGLGAIPGFLVAGIVLGPSGLGFIENYDEIAHLAELGVVLLLFVIGIEINPSRLWKMKRLVLGLGSLQVFITGGVITVIVHATLTSSWEISLLIGSALALSSTAFVLQLLTEKRCFLQNTDDPLWVFYCYKIWQLFHFWHLCH